ncbi:MAG TPA: carboxylating nicotinate-nucleotide diphosphorylase [Solirubrobacterales bacterium]|nr:carboxylating nicotinate-nucleotide diphosphorylase [Solirubrobacterales bacterium]
MSVDPAVSELVAAALAEDLGDGDLTSDATVPADARGRAKIVQKQSGVVAGLDVAAEAFRQTGAGALDKLVVEGTWSEAVPRQVAIVAGPARALLAGERVALNLLGHLSGVATLTARFVAASRSEGGRAVILDTRKTTPLLRSLEKAAVRAGGGQNHRMGLDDAILVKENHIALAGGLAEAVAAARAAHPDLPIEVECRDATDVEAALATGASRLLLDNMDLEDLGAAVAARDASAGPPVALEASGGVGLDTVAAISATGVDFISVGALTHSAPALDLSLLLEA